MTIAWESTELSRILRISVPPGNKRGEASSVRVDGEGEPVHQHCRHGIEVTLQTERMDLAADSRSKGLSNWENGNRGR